LFDVFAVIAFYTSLPSKELTKQTESFTITEPWHSDGKNIRIYMRVALIIVSVIVVFLIADRNFSSVVGSLREEPLVLEPAMLSLGSGKLGTESSVAIRIENYSSHAIRLTGFKASCRVLVCDSMPVKVPAKSAIVVTLSARLLGTVGKADQKFFIFTDDELQPVLSGDCTWTVVD
jgi:hypothetical protein